MARQLGLGVSRIVIDPGHGGHDPGAKGKGGVTEAELVLDVSRRLQKLLEKVRGVDVILTRDSDCFVPLQERTAIANREGADLFLSIHANASANDQAHWKKTTNLMLIHLGIWLFFGYVVHMFVVPLNKIDREFGVAEDDE